MHQTKARMTLKDAPVMWRRINSIGVILDCNSTYASALRYSKQEIIGRPIFEHVPKDSWQAMNDSLKVWFETGKVTDQKITFLRSDGTTFPGLLQATSIYDESKNLLGSNTIIFDTNCMNDSDITRYKKFFKTADETLGGIKHDYHTMDDESRSEYDGLKKMYEMMRSVDLTSSKGH
ncbi:MAG: PAS domain-containing protein [Nitrosopumilus sp. B06]|nr:MAG: PAS domain-containing protein [Nitrosopumilus sp. B06]